MAVFAGTFCVAEERIIYTNLLIDKRRLLFQGEVAHINIVSFPANGATRTKEVPSASSQSLGNVS